jgi:hypothetical protein
MRRKGTGAGDADKMTKLTPRRCRVLISLYENNRINPSRNELARTMTEKKVNFEAAEKAVGSYQALSQYLAVYTSALALVSNSLSIFTKKKWVKPSNDRPRVLPGSMTGFYKRGPYYKLTGKGRKLARMLAASPESEWDRVLQEYCGLRLFIPDSETEKGVILRVKAEAS